MPELFETCPFCSQRRQLELDQLKSMVLCGKDESMQCEVCNNSFKLPDSELIKGVARHQREIKYGQRT